MIQTWRWFGPQDPVTLQDVKQAGASGIVTALHHLYRGEAWPLQDVMRRKEEIEAEGLTWPVVESIPVHDAIKLRSPLRAQYIAAWKDSLRAIAKGGIKIVCYNFMPVVDWTRTDLMWVSPSTAFALRFDLIDFAVYDVLVLQRKGAEADYSTEQIATAKHRFEAMPEDRRKNLEQNIIAGLPGAEASYDRESLRRKIEEYEGLTPEDLRANLISFLQEVVPVAEELGVRLAIHPDDPPWSLFGLPRVVSTAADARDILHGIDTPANGLTFCVGSYGARADNDLLAMIREFGPRIHFAHLRQVTRECERSFHEAVHLDGSSDMVGVISALLEEEVRRCNDGLADHEIPMRPDHGHLLSSDLHAKSNPGYSFVGRLKGLAELRGVMHALRYAVPKVTR
jgi:mannonate dehydratase